LKNLPLLRVENKYSQELLILGQKIRALRLSKNLTQSDLASHCDVDIRTIQRIEKGGFNMSLKVFFSICDSLQTKPEDLIVINLEN
jgi:DNA-binding XRE family transcriptional regulator